MRKIICLALFTAITAISVMGCSPKSLAIPESTLQISAPKATNAIEGYSSSETVASDAAVTAEANIEQDVYAECIDTLLSKHVEWSKLNDDIAGALCFMRMGENGPFDCYTPIVHSDDAEYYATHNYDDRTVIGGAIQILNSNFKQGETCDQILIFGYRLGVNSYFNSRFASENRNVFLLINGEITKFEVFGIQELALENIMDYTNGIIPAEAHDLINTLESYTSEQKLAYYGQIANIAQCPDSAGSKVLILCSDGKALDAHTMSVLC